MTLRRLTCLALLLCVGLTAACGGKKRPPAASTGAPGSTAGSGTGDGTDTTTEPVSEGPDFSPIDPTGPTGVDNWDPAATEGQQGPLEDIFFGYDQASLDEKARQALEKHALWLQNHRDAKLVVEGHCDERGTVEYNLALGEQRARAAFDYLRSLGITEDRMSIVSFGKEKPLDPGRNEAAWARNRRAHFVVTR